MKKSTGEPPPLRCAHCGKDDGPAEKLVQCTACRQVRYCGKQCQRAHWYAAHQAQCKQFRKLSAAAAKQKQQLGGKGLQQSPGKCSPPQQTAPEKARPSAFASGGSKTVAGTKEECTICLDSLASRECLQLPCGHVYHQSCVKGLRKYGVNDLCPQCRARLPPGPTATRDEGIGLVVAAEQMKQGSTLRSQRHTEAVVLLRQSLAEDSSVADAHHVLGCALMGCKDIDIDGAEAAYRAAIRIDPKNLGALQPGRPAQRRAQ